MRQAAIVLLAFMTASCMSGVRTEDGTINLGPNAFGDDPIHHQPYPSYAEYAVATHELDEMAKDGYSHDQQVCFASSMLTELPDSLRTELNQYATGEKTLMESELKNLSDRTETFAKNEDVIRSVAARFKANCMKT